MILKNTSKLVGVLIESLVENKAWKAIKFISDKHIIRATRPLLRKKISNIGNLEILLTFGKPNYEEREFIKLCKKAKESFPVKGILLKFPPKSRKEQLR